MKTSNTTTCTAGDFGQSSLRLDALLIYEDRGTGLRARRAFQHVLEQLGVEVDFTVELWRFELLSEPTVRNWVLNKTVEVDIIFVAAHGQRELPEAVLTLLKQWFTRKSDDPRALAVSLDSSVRETASTNQLLASLQAAARPAGVDVFPHFNEAPQLGSEARALVAEEMRREPEAYLTLGS